MALPNPGMTIDFERTAIVITDPQNDFLSPEGVSWGVVGESITKNNTVANIDELMKAAKKYDLLLAISPHYYLVFREKTHGYAVGMNHGQGLEGTGAS